MNSFVLPQAALALAGKPQSELPQSELPQTKWNDWVVVDEEEDDYDPENIDCVEDNVSSEDEDNESSEDEDNVSSEDEDESSVSEADNLSTFSYSREYVASPPSPTPTMLAT